MSEKKLFTKYSLMLIPVGILINFIFVHLAKAFELPLYLDNIGIVLTSALGGYFPGMVVGFTSNLINGISDPITIYYGIISILTALATAFLTKLGSFRSVKKTAVLILVLAFIGGVIGSVLTWMLYGFEFGSGISAPYAISLFEHTSLGKFFSQLTADTAIDVVDKTITIIVATVIIKLLPKALIAKFPFGEHLLPDSAEKSSKKTEIESRNSLVHSLRAKVLIIIIGSAAVLGILATVISYRIYCDTMNERFVDICRSATELMSKVVDPEKIDGYLENGDENEEDYARTKENLYSIRDSFPKVLYMYVYQIREDGCHVVFDLDSVDGLEGEQLGTLIPFDDSFSDQIDDLLAGNDIEPLITNDTYGWLLTIYKPIFDKSGNCAAYVAVDVDMESVVTDRYIFFIKMISLMFGFAIILFVITVWLAEKHLINPINSLTLAADRFAFGSEGDRESSIEQLRRLNIRTGDEIELLYHSFSSTMADITGYIDTISSLQENTMICFANLVESRDNTTGEHIKRTALYSRILAEQLREDGKHTDVINDDYIFSVEKSAPLHDVGKIAIPDAILTKPGRLTKEEFNTMKTHVTAGKQIIEDLLDKTEGLEYVREAQNMAAYHHERWDGTGYATGLKGEEIPLSARIMAVSDVFDALTSRRSYKPPFSTDEALDIIVAESGTHFDPDVVEALQHCFKYIVEIHSAIKDKEPEGAGTAPDNGAADGKPADSARDNDGHDNVNKENDKNR